MQNKLKLASILFLLVSFVCAAQGTDNPPPPMPPPPPGLAINNGVWILLVFGLILGVYYQIKKLQERKATPVK